tara:strand:- start:286 stop:528 length:243 start_codon:yes stop_codon:yes gene_type:complete
MKNSDWLICPNWIEVRCFTKNIKNNDKFIESMFIDTGIVMGVHGDKPPLMKKRKEVKIEEARKIWQKLITEGWQITNQKW